MKSVCLMRQAKWSPSLVPTDDQSVYLILDDFGRHGRCWREADVEKADLETVITDLWMASTTTLSRSSASTRPKPGRATCQKTSPRKSRGDAVSMEMKSRLACRTSWSDTRYALIGDSSGLF